MSDVSLRRRGTGLPTSAADELAPRAPPHALRAASRSRLAALALLARRVRRLARPRTRCRRATSRRAAAASSSSTSRRASTRRRPSASSACCGRSPRRRGESASSSSPTARTRCCRRTRGARSSGRCCGSSRRGRGRLPAAGRFGGAAAATAARRRTPREESPWSLTFRGGTRISTGLAEARAVIEREGNRSLSVLLLSDLDNSGFDTSALTEEVLRTSATGIDLRVVPLFPAPEDGTSSQHIVGEERLRRPRRAPAEHDRAGEPDARRLVAVGARPARRGAARRCSPSTSGGAHGSRGGGQRDDAVVAPAGRRRGRGRRARRRRPRVLVALAADVLRWDRQAARRRRRLHGAARPAAGSRTRCFRAGSRRRCSAWRTTSRSARAVDQFWKSEPREPHPRVRRT